GVRADEADRDADQHRPRPDRRRGGARRGAARRRDRGGGPRRLRARTRGRAAGAAVAGAGAAVAAPGERHRDHAPRDVPHRGSRRPGRADRKAPGEPGEPGGPEREGGVVSTSDRVELAVIGRQRPAVLEALGAEFTLHQVASVDDVAGSLGPAAGRVRGALSFPMVGFSAAMMDALPKLEIVTLYGVGLERTDLAAARERGVVVTTTPVLYEDVADTAVVLAMDVSRRITSGDRWLRAGHWAAGGQAASGRRFSGKRAGILGMGRIGRALAKRLEAFDMQIGYYDPRP